jgi:hypothetical protein
MMRYLFNPRAPLLWLLVGGLPGIVAWWLVFAAAGTVRRGFLVAAATLTGGLFILAVAGYVLAQIAPTAPPVREDGRSLLPGMLLVLGGMGVAVLAITAGIRAWWRARRETPAAAPAPEPQREQAPEKGAHRQEREATAPRPRRVVVRGCPRDAAVALEHELQDVADTLGRDILVFVQPRVGDMTAFLHGEAVVVQVQRPQLRLVTRAIATFLGDGAVAHNPGYQRQQPGPTASYALVPARRPRQDDLAAAIGGAKAGKGEG